MSTPLMDTISRLVREAAMEQAAERERIARALIVESLPRGLGWMVDHPRVLKLFYRVFPRRRPVMVVRLGP